MSLILVSASTPSNAGLPVRRKGALAGRGISYHMGVDGISLPFVILTTALMPFCILRELEVGHEARARNT